MMQNSEVNLDMQVEDLLLEYPEAVGFLIKQGLRCIRCGEPFWGTLGTFLEEGGVDNPQHMVDQLNVFLSRCRRKTW
jgi:hypothetical protein